MLFNLYNKKYRKVLAIAEIWTNDEIAEMRGNLKSQLESIKIMSTLIWMKKDNLSQVSQGYAAVPIHDMLVDRARLSIKLALGESVQDKLLKGYYG